MDPDEGGPKPVAPPAIPAPRRRAPQPIAEEPTGLETPDEGGHSFFNPFRRQRKFQPEIIAERIAAWGAHRSSAEPVDTISYTAAMCMVLDHLYSPARRDKLLHAAIIASRLELMYFHNPNMAKARDRPGALYKFIAPVPVTSRFYGRSYKPGDSWCETLGFSFRMWKSAWPIAGASYHSMGAWRAALAAGMEFIEADGTEKLYAVVHDNVAGYSLFFRNHQLANLAFAPLRERN
jgi:hypothetical protein